jgi:hypothetical protein
MEEVAADQGGPAPSADLDPGDAGDAGDPVAAESVQSMESMESALGALVNLGPDDSFKRVIATLCYRIDELQEVKCAGTASAGAASPLTVTHRRMLLGCVKRTPR